MNDNDMAEYKNLQLDKQLCFALYAATHAITRAYRSRLGKVGLTYPQYLVMLVLWETDGLPVNHLADKLYLDSGTLTPLLKRLEKIGFIARQRDSDDERVVNVRLTQVGSNLKHEVATMQQSVACQTGLSSTEFVELRAALHRLTETIRENQQQAMMA